MGKVGRSWRCSKAGGAELFKKSWKIMVVQERKACNNIIRQEEPSFFGEVGRHVETSCVGKVGRTW